MLIQLPLLTLPSDQTKLAANPDYRDSWRTLTVRATAIAGVTPHPNYYGASTVAIALVEGLEEVAAPYWAIEAVMSLSALEHTLVNPSWYSDLQAAETERQRVISRELTPYGITHNRRAGLDNVWTVHSVWASNGAFSYLLAHHNHPNRHSLWEQLATGYGTTYRAMFPGIESPLDHLVRVQHEATQTREAREAAEATHPEGE